jgi:heme exporter protein B
MTGFLKKVWAIVAKDVLSELRTKEMFSSMFIFALLVIVIFNFAFDPGMSYIRDVAPGILWVAFTFAGILGLNRSFVQEQENNCLQGMMLTPIDRGAIYLGKFLGNLLFMMLVELVALPLFVLFFNLSILENLPVLVLVMVLSTIGFAAVGTLLSAMSVATRTREVMLPVLLFPVIVPVIIAAVKATGKILGGKGLDDIIPWIKLLTGFDIIFLVVCFLTFEYVIE